MAAWNAEFRVAKLLDLREAPKMLREEDNRGRSIGSVYLWGKPRTGGKRGEGFLTTGGDLVRTLFGKGIRFTDEDLTLRPSRSSGETKDRIFQRPNGSSSPPSFQESQSIWEKGRQAGKH